MVEGQKTEGQEITDPKGDEETTVTISQEKLNSLISEKFKKGAEKANAQLLESLGVDSIDSLKSVLDKQREAEEASKTELQKAQEAIAQANAEKEALLKEKEALAQKNAIQGLAVDHGIKEVDYFELELKKHSSEEGFEADKFIEQLKEEKPFIFGQSAPIQPIKTDTTGNTLDNPNDLNSIVQGLSFNDLKKLQKKL